MNLYLCTVNFKVGVVIDLKATVSRFLFIVHDGLNFAVLGGVGVVFVFLCFSGVSVLPWACFGFPVGLGFLFLFQAIMCMTSLSHFPSLQG